MRSCSKARANWPLLLLIAFTFLMTLTACWIIPYRMAFGPSGSYYTFYYLPDEAMYAAHLQPLHAGAHANNPLNGVTDPNALSPYFLETICRSLVCATGLEVITIFWIWRIVFPIGVAIALFILARTCLSRRLPVWSVPLCLAAVAASFALLYCANDVVMAGYPLRYMVSRIITCVEIPISLLLAWLYIRFLKAPGVLSGIPLVLGAVALLHLRPYVAIPWGISIAAGVTIMVVARSLTLRQALLLLGVAVLALIPLLLVLRGNAASRAYTERFQRVFVAIPYTLHPRWLFFLIMAFLLGRTARLVDIRFRPFFLGAAFTLVVLPFIGGLLSIAIEMTANDRFVGFYLAAWLAAGLLVLDKHSARWRGRHGFAVARRCTLALCACAILASGLLVRNGVQYDLRAGRSPYASGIEEQCFVPAYNWMRQNTPADALVIEDDGVDWGQMEVDERFLKGFWRRMIWHEDLFDVVARRRRIWSDRLWFHIISNEDLLDLYMLQQGTLGLKISREHYRRVFERFKPSYILWHKASPAPRPRGPSSDLNCSIVFEDEVSEIWKVEGQ